MKVLRIVMPNFDLSLVVSFAGLGFLSLYLAGKLHLFDHKGHTGKAWISVVPLMAAGKHVFICLLSYWCLRHTGLVAISRTMDYRHHWQDVVVGSLLGLSLAWFSYRQYYPPLSHPLSHRPYSPRISRNRTPLSGSRMHDGYHSNANEETERLHLSGHPHHNDHIEELPLQATSMDHVDAPLSLTEVWKQGEGEEIVPPGQTPSPSTPGHELI